MHNMYFAMAKMLANVYPLEVGTQMANVRIFFRVKHAELSAWIGSKGQDGGLL